MSSKSIEKNNRITYNKIQRTNSFTYSQYTQFHQCIRSFCIRYLNFIKEKQYSTQQIDQIQININKIIFNHKLSQETILIKVAEFQLKSDYHQVIILTLFQDLIKWTKDYMADQQNCSIHEINSQNNSLSNIKNEQNGLNNKDQLSFFSLLVEKSTNLLNSQQQFHTIVPKQNELLRQLLLMPFVINNLEHFRLFYRKLKDIKQFYPSAVKESQKILFLKTIEQVVEFICKEREDRQIKTIEFIFTNNFAQLQVIQESHELVMSRLKIIKKIVKSIWYFNSEILYKSSFLIVKYSPFVLKFPHLFSSTINLYEELMPRLIQKVSPALLIIFNHLIINNIRKLLEQGSKTKNYFLLESLLDCLSNIFAQPYIQYSMRNYDSNFMEESLCQRTLNILFQFIQNRSNEKRYEYEIFKKYLQHSITNIRQFLLYQEQNGLYKRLQEKLVKFYEVKKKEYHEIVKDMNQKPKKLFKKLESLTNNEIKQEIMKKYIRIAKKSTHLEIKPMIDIFASNNLISEELFSEYINNLFQNLNKDVTLEEFLRYFSSNFFLNGQSQQILRVLDKITQLYYHHQPKENKTMKDSDSTYTFANAIILLNTDLHNPQNQSKMSLESFFKICKKINKGQDLPTELLSKTYHSIKMNKINTFRNKCNVHGISPYNFTLICNAENESKTSYYDHQMKMLDDDNFYNFYIYDTLSSIIDERQSNKLEQLIADYQYNNTAYECEIIQSIRKLTKKKMHIPLHGLEKILQHANFKNSKTSQKLIQYLWLATNLIQNFYQYLPTNVICEVLIMTWKLRNQIKDNMYLREKAEVKKIKKMLRQFNKKNQKKSIINMFSNFLSSNEEQSQSYNEVTGQEFQITSAHLKKMNYKVLSERILEVLMKSSHKFQSQNEVNSPISLINDKIISSKSPINHRIKSIEFFINYLKNDEQKIFEEFLSLLYLIFRLLYRINEFPEYSQGLTLQSLNKIEQRKIASLRKIKSQKIEHSSQISPSSNQKRKSVLNQPSQKLQKQEQQKIVNAQEIKQIINRPLLLSSEMRIHLFQYEEMIQDLFYELLGVKQSQITKRIDNLRKKDLKKFNILYHYSCYWVLKILISKIGSTNAKFFIQQNSRQLTRNNSDYLLEKSLELLEKVDKDTYLDLLFEFEQRTKQVYSVIQNQSKNQNAQQNKNQDINPEGEQIKQYYQNEKVKQQKITQESVNHELDQIIQCYLIRYRKLIAQLYKNGCRIFGELEFNKAKQYKWLASIYKSANQLHEKNQQCKQKIEHETYQKQQKIKKDNEIQINQQQIEVKQSEKEVNNNINHNNNIQNEQSEFQNLQKRIQEELSPVEVIKVEEEIESNSNALENEATKATQNTQNQIIHKTVQQNQIEQASLQIQKQKIEQNDSQTQTIHEQKVSTVQNEEQNQRLQQQISKELQQYNEQQLLGMPIYLL